MVFYILQYVIDGLKAKGHDTFGLPLEVMIPGNVEAIYSKCVPSILGQATPCMESVADWRAGGIPDGF